MPDYFSPELKDLIKKLLEKDANKRLDAKKAMEHPWFEKKDGEGE